MRLASTMLLATALAVAACDNRANVQCLENPNCNLTTGGTCAVAPSGNHWCAYPDATCPGGYRFSDQDVGDGVSGMCVAATDAGVDAPPDGIDGDRTCKLRIAFVDGKPSFGSGNQDDNTGRRQVWVANPDGSGMINLSSGAGVDSAHPSWSPDGLKVAFASSPGGGAGHYHIFVVNVDGSGLTALTSAQTVGFGSSASYPIWSPDGTRIAFLSTGGPWIMNANGTGATPLAVPSALQASGQMAWSPDSKQLAFEVQIIPSGFALYVATISDTSTPLKINSGNTFELIGGWAPSPKITFSSLSDVFTVSGDGTSLFNVTQDAANRNSGAVSFNGGNSLVFYSYRDNGYAEIWSIPATGGAATQITHHTIVHGGDQPNAVSRDGGVLAFSRRIQTVQPDNSVIISYQLGVSKIDGSGLKLFNAPGASNATEARFSACP